MSSPLSAKLRFVKCPKCRRVLPEVSNVPVYQCGGCNAVLQVKKRVNGTKDTGIHVYETDINQKHEVQHDSSDKTMETGHMNSKVGDCDSSDRESFETEDGLAKFPRKLINGKGSEDLSSPDESEDFSTLDDVAEKEKKNVSGQVSPSNNDVTCHDIKNLSPETGTSSEYDEDAITAYLFGNIKKEKVIAVEDSVLSPRRLSRESTSTENFSPPQQREATEVAPINLQEKEFPEIQNSSNQDLIVNDFSVEELEDSSPKVVTKGKSKQNFLSRFVFKNSRKEKPLNVSIGSSILDSPRLSASETKLEENHMLSPNDEQVEQPQLEKHSRFDSASSEETLENIVFTNADDQDTDQYLRQLKGKSKEAESSHVKADSFSREKNKKPCETKRFSNQGPVRSWTQFKNDDGLSRAHLHPRNDYGKKTDLPPRPVDPEDEKMRLKRMVFELQDELNRSRTPKGYSSGGLSHVVPPCYHVSPEMDTCHDLSGYPTRCCHREPFPNQCKCTRIHCSAPMFQQNNCTAHINGNHYKNPYPCSDFLTKNFDKYHEEKKDYRAKKHVLPVKSGAPFVVCDSCSLLLQLPADFLLFRKRHHQLRCSSCSHVLKFSLRSGCHLDRYDDNEDNEPGDLRDTNKKGKNISFNCPHVDSVCISDDYGPSSCKSCSTESNDVHKKTISGGFVDHRDLRKNMYKDSVSKAEKSSPKLRGRDVSPLFRLMDYNSARELLK